MSKKKSTKKRKRKIKYKNVFKFLLFVILIIIIFKILFNLSITNIYISGNNVLNDQEIINIAELGDYPSIIQNPTYLIKKRLISSDDIIDAKVRKDGTKIYIEVIENRPLFYNANKGLIVMLDKTEKNGNIITPYLVNYVPDTIYDKFVTSMSKIDVDILNRISDIEYNPNSVDAERFYLNMTDGNYVYLTLNSFDKINSYIEMLKQFQGRKGVLYLDSGEYFEIKD